MDLRKVKKLIELVEESGISELEVSSGDESIRIVMPNSAAAEGSVPPAPSVSTAVPASSTSCRQRAYAECDFANGRRFLPSGESRKLNPLLHWASRLTLARCCALLKA